MIGAVVIGPLTRYLEGAAAVEDGGSLKADGAIARASDDSQVAKVSKDRS